MYKKGKTWCYMALATIATATGLVFSHSNVMADSNVQTDDRTQVVSASTNVNDQTVALTSTNKSSADQANNRAQTTVTTNDYQTNAQEASFLAESKVATVQNGWVKQANGDQAYYRNGQLDSGREYVQLPTMNQTSGSSYYLMQDGVAQSGLQEWQGTYWYFDPDTYQLVKNNYVDPNGDNSGYLTDQNGAALSGIQKWQGTYYAFDRDNYRLVKNQKFNEWGYQYQIDDQGRVASGLYKEANGDIYYYSPVSFLKEKNTYIVPEGTDDGYLFGNDGKALTGVQKWQGTYYYFDPTTKQLVRNQYVQSQWGLWYMFGDDGKIVTGPKMWQGAMYFFDPSSYLVVKNDYRVPAGSDRGYLLGADGKALTGVQKWQGTYYYFDPSTYQLVKNNYVQSQWGQWYMFGDDGKIVTGPHMWQGSMYYFDPDTYEIVKNDYRVPAGEKTGYLLGSDSQALTGFQTWQGTRYYFNPSNYKLATNTVVQEGNKYWYADANGFLTPASGSQAFLLSIKQAAQDGWRQYGVLPSVTAAQAILESAWGKSGLATKGHNLFGIKGSYNGQSVVMRTAEWSAAKGYYYINDAFRKYPSNYESVVDHGRFLASNSRYHNLLWDRNYASVTAKLQQDGYATAPTYASSLNNVIRTYGLDAWDREVF